MIVTGSASPNTQSATRVTFAAQGAGAEVLRARSQTLEWRVRHRPPARLSHWIERPEQIHARLFRDLVPDLPEAVGGLRGQPDTPLQHAQREVRVVKALPATRARDMCLDPAAVPQAMAVWTADLQQLWGQGAGDAARIRELADLCHRFFVIHPFLDGNGHVWRLLFILLVRRKGAQVSARWTVATRPYGPEFSFALQRFPVDPVPLENALRFYLV